MKNDEPKPIPIPLHEKVLNCIFVVPEYLTVSSSGPAGTEQYYSMGVFRLTEEKHNNKSVWYRHSEIMAMFYDNG